MAKKKAKPNFHVTVADCVQYMANNITDGVDLVIADCPYNIGQEYLNYDDKKSVTDYLEWSRSWIKGVCSVLKSTGSLWIFINDNFVSEIDVICKNEFLLRPRSKVIWYYTFGQNGSKNFTPSHTNLLYYTKHKTKFTFNAEEPLLRHPSARQVKYKDKRANPSGRLPDNTWAIFPEMLPDGFGPNEDTWLESRVCGTFKDRQAHVPNQIPVPIMERIVLSTSSPGDTVFDPFCGTGSSGVAAVRHNRKYLGVDLSTHSCNEALERIANES